MSHARTRFINSQGSWRSNTMWCDENGNWYVPAGMAQPRKKWCGSLLCMSYNLQWCHGHFAGAAFNANHNSKLVSLQPFQNVTLFQFKVHNNRCISFPQSIFTHLSTSLKSLSIKILLSLIFSQCSQSQLFTASSGTSNQSQANKSRYQLKHLPTSNQSPTFNQSKQSTR